MSTSEWLARLSVRQREVLLLAVDEGLSGPRIAQRLHVSEETVKSHLGAIFERLEVRGRTELTITYWRHRVEDVSAAAAALHRAA